MSLAAMCACGHQHKAKKHGDVSRRDKIIQDNVLETVGRILDVRT